MPDLLKQTLDLAHEFKIEADRLDLAFLKTGDPRAIQGGDFCREASDFREYRRRLLAIAREIEP
jgi:hypothetical protein